MFKKLIIIVALCLPLALTVSASGAPLVSYTVSGISGNWILDFSVSNSDLRWGESGIYLFGVDLPYFTSPNSSPGWPNGWNWIYGGTPTWNLYILGGSNIDYHMGWQADYTNGENATSILTGETLNGFKVLFTGAQVPTSVHWFAFANYFEQNYMGTDCIGGNLPNSPGTNNPIFEGTATDAVPEPATLLLVGFGLLGLAGARAACKPSRS